MSVSRQPLLNPEQESRLKDLLLPLWMEHNPDNEAGFRYNAKQIATELGFGDPGPYEKFKPYHIYHYRTKFGFPVRKAQTVHTIVEGGIRRNTRYRVPPKYIKRISPKEYIERIHMSYPTDQLERAADIWDTLPENTKKLLIEERRINLMKAAYNVVQMYSPLRKSEIYERTLSDLEITEDTISHDKYLTINLFRKKKSAKNPQFLPYDIRLDYQGMEIVTCWIEERRQQTNDDKNALIFPLSSWSAWDAVKRISPDMYPHYFRFEYITEELSDPEFAIVDVMSDTGLHIVTINRYLQSGTDVARTRARRKRKKLDDRRGKRERQQKGIEEREMK